LYYFCFVFLSGYIRIGSNVWARAINGDYYRGVVTALTDKVHVKFEDGETISHDRYFAMSLKKI